MKNEIDYRIEFLKDFNDLIFRHKVYFVSERNNPIYVFPIGGYTYGELEYDDENGRYYQAREPDRLLGYSIHTSLYVLAVDTGEEFVNLYFLT